MMVADKCCYCIGYVLEFWQLKPAMASDSDGSYNSVVILRSIREKLVEYKESLLRYVLVLVVGCC